VRRLKEREKEAREMREMQGGGWGFGGTYEPMKRAVTTLPLPFLAVTTTCNASPRTKRTAANTRTNVLKPHLPSRVL
jgi:hypothetical protein